MKHIPLVPRISVGIYPQSASFQAWNCIVLSFAYPLRLAQPPFVATAKLHERHPPQHVAKGMSQILCTDHLTCNSNDSKRVRSACSIPSTIPHWLLDPVRRSMPASSMQSLWEVMSYVCSQGTDCGLPQGFSYLTRLEVGQEFLCMAMAASDQQAS